MNDQGKPAYPTIKIDFLAWFASCLSILALGIGMWAFRAISDFFLRHHVLAITFKTTRLHAYLVSLTRDTWAIRDFLIEYVAPSLVGLGLASLILLGMKRRREIRRYTVAWTAIRLGWVAFLLSVFDLVVLVFIYIIAILRIY
jgi:hypothetical protein